MDRQKILKVIDIVSYVALINATIFVLLFEYTSSIESDKLSITSYIVAFVASALFSVLRFIYSKLPLEDSSLLLTKKQVVINIIKFIMSIILLVFVIIIKVSI